MLSLEYLHWDASIEYLHWDAFHLDVSTGYLDAPIEFETSTGCRRYLQTDRPTAEKFSVRTCEKP